MKKAVSVFIVILMAGIITAAWAQPSKEEARLDQNASALDKDASRSGGEIVVSQRLEKQFKVDEVMINNLRGQKLGYGEIAIALAMAEKLPGGITDANVGKIASMRQGPPVQGWGEVAKKLGFKLGPVISSVEKAAGGSRKELEKVEHDKMKSEKAERLDKPERLERPGRPEMPMRPERRSR